MSSAALAFVSLWFLLAIPSSLLARRLGHPMWPSYIVWCPYLGFTLLHWSFGETAMLRAPSLVLFIVAIVPWIPGAAYLWFLALRK
jgi:hypothetical protein